MHKDGYFDERVAATYDEIHADLAGPEIVNSTVAFLVDLVGSGNALEFGIGTGRIALPLTDRGVIVHGIEMSRAMVAKLVEKPKGAEIPVTIGDFATAATGESYSIVFLLFNTIMNLTTQAAQVDCFRNAAAHLEPGGHFVVEVMVPQLRELSTSRRCHVFGVSEKKWGIDEYDTSTQSVITHHLKFTNGKIERSSVPFRYVWPGELDLMAQIAGMTLSGRWENWRKDAFTNESHSHISVWEKTA